MKLSVPTNWDDRVVDELAGLPIDNYYGKLRTDVVGGGRAGNRLAAVTRGQAAAHVKRIHQRGGRFFYVLNGACMGNKEYLPGPRREVFKLLDWLAEMEVDGVVVALPMLLDLVKKRYPGFKVATSVFSYTDTINMACRLADMGADEVTLPETFNRDFNFLRSLSRACPADLILVVNSSCIYGCPVRRYHSNAVSHASQPRAKSLRFDYLTARCNLMRFRSPGELIRTPWIRPEDLRAYEAVGVKKFKLVGRTQTTEWVTKTAKAYAARRSPDNFAELLARTKATTTLFPRPTPGAPHVDFIIDNSRLGGFLKRFQKMSCAYVDCRECRYCDKVAEKAVRMDGRVSRRMQSVCERLLTDFAKR